MRNISSSSKSSSTRDFAYNEIKKEIITGNWAPEQPIVEECVATKLEISRTPLREALQRLEIEELVVRQRNGRLKVAPISIQEVKELFTVRRKLEGIIALEATENATEKDINHLSTLTLMIKETFKKGNMEDILYYGGKFHTYLYQISGNKTVVNILSQLNDHILRYRHLVPLGSVDRLENSVIEHEQILDCISKRDKQGAKIALEKHIEKSLAEAIKAIKKEMKS